MLKIETQFEHFDEAELAVMLSVLPPTWRDRTTRPKPFAARLRSAVGYTLLHAILREGYGITEPPPIVTDKHGKPHFESLPLFFSISHCKAAVACIVEDAPVGIDVQDILYDARPALKARITVPLPPEDFDAKSLTALWTQKEASAKLDGKGLTIPLNILPLPTHQLETTDCGEYIVTIARYPD